MTMFIIFFRDIFAMNSLKFEAFPHVPFSSFFNTAFHPHIKFHVGKSIPSIFQLLDLL